MLFIWGDWHSKRVINHPYAIDPRMGGFFSLTQHLAIRRNNSGEMSSPSQLWWPNLHMPPSDYLHIPPGKVDISGPLQKRHRSTQQVRVGVSKRLRTWRWSMPADPRTTDNWLRLWFQLVGIYSWLNNDHIHELNFCLPSLSKALHLSSKQTANCALRVVLLAPRSAG